MINAFSADADAATRHEGLIGKVMARHEFRAGHRGRLPGEGNSAAKRTPKLAAERLVRLLAILRDAGGSMGRAQFLCASGMSENEFRDTLSFGKGAGRLVVEQPKRGGRSVYRLAVEVA
ncbi:MAG: hypothetical protein VKL39_24015, partial [Leptolyngbyaceae bacterium]|nr:hypothetical protein [Leptolyngbyaceae bacterium]